MQPECELYHPVSDLRMTHDEHQCLMFSRQYIAIEYQITPYGVKEYKYE